MRFELIVALRYLKEGRGQTWLILTGIAVGVGVIVFLSALINGLQATLIEQTLGSQAHVVVRPLEEMPRVLTDAGAEVRGLRIQRPPQRVRSIAEWRRVVEDIESLPGVAAVAPTVAGPGMAVRGQGSNSIAVRGLDLESYDQIVDVGSRIVEGSADLSTSQALIGTELATDLGVGVGDRIRVQTGASTGQARGTVTDEARVFTVAGIFDFNVKELNERWVFVSLRAGQAMFALEGGVSTIEVLGTEIFDAEALANQITERTGLPAESWMETNEQLLIALRSQSSSSIMIQTFVILAVALGIASVLAVSVVQKAREIGILRATGTSTGQVMRIFLIQGGLLGLGGAIAGAGIGTVLALAFSHFAQNSDGSQTFPVALTPVLFGRALVTAVGVGLIAAVLPARRAARLDPADAIRDG